jgi:predicted small secreted protein
MSDSPALPVAGHYVCPKKVTTSMKARMLTATLILLGLLIGGLSLTGCNTWKGVGKDVERTGEAMQGD